MVTETIKKILNQMKNAPTLEEATDLSRQFDELKKQIPLDAMP